MALRRLLARPRAILRSRRVLLVTGVGAGLVAGVAYGLLAEEHYRAVATLFADAGAYERGRGEIPEGVARSPDLDLLRSDRVALRLAQNEHLAEEPALRAEYLRAVDSGAQPLERLAHLLAGRVQARASGDGSVVELAVTLPSAELAARVANGYARAWSEVIQELRAASIRDGVARAHGDLIALRARLGAAQARGASAPGEGGHTAAEARFGELARMASSPLRALPGSAGEGATGTLAGASDSLVADEGEAPARTFSAVGGLAAPAAHGDAVARAATDDDIRLAQQSLERAEDSLARLSAQEVAAATPVHLLMPARTPESSLKPSLERSTLLGALAGLLLGLATVALAEALDRRVRAVSDVAAGLGVVVLGQLPATRTASATGRRVALPLAPVPPQS